MYIASSQWREQQQNQTFDFIALAGITGVSTSGFIFFSTLFILSPHSSHPRAKMADRSSCSTSPLCVGLALLFLTVVTMRYWTVSVEKDDLQNDLGQVKFQLLKEWVCAILRERERERALVGKWRGYWAFTALFQVPAEFFNLLGNKTPKFWLAKPLHISKD